MSLIHEALKKLEGIKEDSSRPRGYTSPGPSSGQGAVPRQAIAAVAAVMGVAVGFYLYLHYYPKTPGKASTAMQNVSTPAEPQPQPGPRTEAASVQSPVDVHADNKKAMALYAAGQAREAADAFLDAINSLQPGAKAEIKSVLYNNLGVSYLAVNDQAKAEGALKKALSLRPAYPEALNNYGVLLERKGDHSGAIKMLRKAASLDPAYPDPHVNIAISLEAAGRYLDSMEEYSAFVSRASSRQYMEKSDYTDKAEEAGKKIKKLNSLLMAR